MPHSAKPKAKAARKIDFDAAQHPVQDERAADYQQGEHLSAGDAEPDSKLKEGMGKEGGGDQAHAGLKQPRARLDSRATPVPRKEANQNTCRTQHVVGKDKASPREIAKSPKASRRALKQKEAAGRKAQGKSASAWTPAGLEAEAVCTHEEAQKPEMARNGQVASPALRHFSRQAIFVLAQVMPGLCGALQMQNGAVNLLMRSHCRLTMGRKAELAFPPTVSRELPQI